MLSRGRAKWPYGGWVACSLAGILMGLATPAAAGGGSGWHFPASWEIEAETLLAVGGPQSPQFGGARLHVGGMFIFFGAEVGLAYEQFDAGDGRTYRGGALDITSRFHPLLFADETTWRYFDPWIGVGVSLGGGALAGKGRVRAGFYPAVGIQFGVAYLGMSVQYRYQELSAPSETPAHLFLFGIGARYAH